MTEISRRNLLFDESKLPKHDGGLHLTHNEYKADYFTAEEAIYWHSYDRNDWISKRQYQRAIEIDSIWTLTVYPDTPIGSYNLYAADLSELLLYLEDPDLYTQKELYLADNSLPSKK